MNSKLYVGNLSYSTTEDALWNLFSQAGTVVFVDLMRDRVSRQSKGFAFVILSNPAEAERAIEMFNGLNVDGNEIRVISFTQRREYRSNRDTRASPYPIKRNEKKRHQ